MFDGKRITRQIERAFNRRGSMAQKECADTERIFESVDDNIAWTETLANIKLRDRLVWFCILSFAVEILLIFLHSTGLLTLPEIVLYAISAHMGGSGFGLGGLLYYITRNLFRNK
jgi:hypothetical protein